MLIGAKLEFKQVENPSAYTEEGTQIAVTSKYKCFADGNCYYVSFSSWTNNQILIIEPDTLKNLDPDGGYDFINKNVIELVESLVSKSTYI